MPEAAVAPVAKPSAQGRSAVFPVMNRLLTSTGNVRTMAASPGDGTAPSNFAPEPPLFFSESSRGTCDTGHEARKNRMSQNYVSRGDAGTQSSKFVSSCSSPRLRVPARVDFGLGPEATPRFHSLRVRGGLRDETSCPVGEKRNGRVPCRGHARVSSCPARSYDTPA
jgi:hypothetical protein